VVFCGLLRESSTFLTANKSTAAALHMLTLVARTNRVCIEIGCGGVQKPLILAANLVVFCVFQAHPSAKPLLTLGTCHTKKWSMLMRICTTKNIPK
jgi:ABC-type transport system involved in cytochrome bd biosynthesis fused ATPase/permease subunit